MSLSRRHFLMRAGAVAAAFGGLESALARRALAFPAWESAPDGYGGLEIDPKGIMDLPEGFSYQIVSKSGQTMDDGLILPGNPDGMAAFPGPNGLTLIIRNHEIEDAHKTPGPFGENSELLGKVNPELIFDKGADGRPCRGGTTTIVWDTREGKGKLVRQFMSLAGTERNCAGGPTPRGTWITCEETTSKKGKRFDQDHGFCFEVPAYAEPALTRPVPLKAMGRFRREACATDPATGSVYQSEDVDDGLMYRFIPVNKDRLVEGGKLQALAAADESRLDTRNWEQPRVKVGQKLATRWVDMDDVESPDNTLRLRGAARGAALFGRTEGMWFGRGAIYFACTTGGAKKLGQLWKYEPAAETLTLFAQPDDSSILQNPDNVTMSPWGDLIVCEDGPGTQHLLGVTPAGDVYKLGRNAISKNELAGATFSPDGTTLFVNIQQNGLTLAIHGPWKR